MSQFSGEEKGNMVAVFAPTQQECFAFASESVLEDRVLPRFERSETHSFKNATHDCDRLRQLYFDESTVLGHLHTFPDADWKKRVAAWLYMHTSPSYKTRIDPRERPCYEEITQLVAPIVRIPELEVLAEYVRLAFGWDALLQESSNYAALLYSLPEKMTKAYEWYDRHDQLERYAKQMNKAVEAFEQGQLDAIVQQIAAHGVPALVA